MSDDLARNLRILALAALCIATPAPAQDLTIIIGKPPKGGAAGFGGSGATPISPTTVIQFLLEPHDSGGAQLAYVVAIRGAPGWYNQHTTWKATDSIPGFDATNWEVGPVHYVVAYSHKEHRLRTFGEEIDLSKANLILVTLGSQGATGASVSADRHITFVMFEPGGFAAQFVPQVPELASFAGLSAAKQ